MRLIPQHITLFIMGGLLVAYGFFNIVVYQEHTPRPALGVMFVGTVVITIAKYSRNREKRLG